MAIEPDGTAIAVQGTTTVTIMVGDGSFIADVVVVDGLIAEVLLGLDFLEQHNCTIQAGERLLTLKNGKIVIPLTSSDTVRKSPRMVVNLLQSVHIPPRREIEVMAAGCGDVSSGVWIVEPVTQKLIRVKIDPAGSLLVAIIDPAGSLLAAKSDPPLQKVIRVQILVDSSLF